MSERLDTEGRKEASEAAIRKYWAEHPLGKYLNQQYCSKNKRPCMACGGYGTPFIERAHIVALFYGGSNLPSNIHMLCSICHKESEDLSGYQYWLWILLKAKLFNYGFDMTYENEDGKRYACKDEYKDKLVKYSKEYTMLSHVKKFETHDAFAYLTKTRANWHLFNIDLTLIDEIDETPNSKQRALEKYLVKMMAVSE